MCVNQVPDRFDHYRFSKDGFKLSWRDTLQAMCDYYGTFRGRWHSNEEWKAIAKSISGLTEDECRKKVIEIEREADGRLAYWQAYQ